jgi:hypothetical protein
MRAPSILVALGAVVLAAPAWTLDATRKPTQYTLQKWDADTGYWNQIETYISQKSRASFSHGMCPDCLKKLYPDYAAAAGTSPPK